MELTHEEQVKVMVERITYQKYVSSGGDSMGTYETEIDRNKLAEVLLELLEKK